jgi:PAS domain S-box-containing protein
MAENKDNFRPRRSPANAAPKPEEKLNSDPSDPEYPVTPNILPDIVFGVSADGTISQVLGGTPDLLQRSSGGIEGQRLEQAFGDELAGLIRKAIHACDTGGRSDAMRCPLVLDTQTRWLTISATPSNAGSDFPQGYVVIARENTRRFEHSQFLQKIAEVAQRTTNYVIVADTRRRITWVNKAFEQRSGYRLAEIRGKTPDNIFELSKIDPATREAMFAAIDSLKSISMKIQSQSSDGTRYWVHDDLQPMFDADGRHSGFMSVQTDITDLEITRKRFEDVIAGANCGTWEYVLSTAKIRVNEIFAKQLGSTADEINPLEFSTWQQMIHNDDRDRVNEKLDDIYAEKVDGFDVEYRVREKSGDWKWVRAFGRITGHNSAGDAVALAGVQLDISEQKKQESAAWDAEIKFQAAQAAQKFAEQRILDIAAISSDWFWEQDETGRFTFMSDGVERALGAKASAFIGQKRSEIMTGISDADLSRLVAIIASRKPINGFVYESDNPGLDIGRRWIRIEAAPLFDENGEFSGYRGLGSDVTDIYRAKAGAEAANQAKSAFLATASHELRTPLNGVIGMAQLLEAMVQDPEQKAMVETIRESGDSLLNILSDLLDMSKIEAGQLELEEIPFSPKELGKKVESLYGQQCRDKGVSFAFLVGSGTDTLRLGDPHRVRQILNNLISNAIKFTEAGEIVVRIRGNPKNPLVLEVSDTGIGMTGDQATHVFDDYQQADSTISRRFGGTGLGLGIVKRIIELMDGEISVDSVPDQGTTFRVVLPFPVCAEPEPEETPEEERHSIAGLRVLAADDNLVNCKIMRTILEQEGVAVTMAHDGQEAVNLWAPGKFDLLLLDIAMPVMDGATALAQIRAREEESGCDETPAIAVTANAMSHQVGELLAKGFDTVVAKPFRREDLVRSISVIT